jgi:hypothetical protein
MQGIPIFEIYFLITTFRTQQIDSDFFFQTWHRCVDFQQRDKPCKPWTQTQLQDPNIPAETKW